MNSKKSILISLLCLNLYVFADTIVESAPLTKQQQKTERRLAYNAAESNDFLIDQCDRDINGVCIPVAYKNAYISPNHYIQYPFYSATPAGGRHLISESDLTNKDAWGQFFTNGTYNAQVGAAYALLNPYNNNYSYGGGFFAQSGHVNGFAIGGTLEAVNPFLQPSMRYMTGEIPYSLLPISQVLTPSQLYLEYQLPDKVQVDAGWITINSPWMNSYDDAMLVNATYQGILANYQLSSNWRLTGIATNAYEEMGSNHFNQDTMYNSSFGGFTTTSTSGQQQIFSDNYTTPGSFGLGAVYRPSANYELNLWAYSFLDYANTFYADTNYDVHLNPINKLNFGIQVGNQNTWGMGATAPQQVGDGSVNSYLAGAKFGYSFDDWFNAELSYDTMFGPQNSFYGGAFISPYTFTIVNDPLYTSGLAGGLIEMGAGNSYRAAVTFKPIPGDSKSKIELAYERFDTVSSSNEYDVDFKWVPNGAPKGLIMHLMGDYATAPQSNIVNAGDFLFIEAITTYTY